jgi:hypothetical protein
LGGGAEIACHSAGESTTAARVVLSGRLAVSSKRPCVSFT